MTTDHGDHVSTYDRLEEPTGTPLLVDTDLFAGPLGPTWFCVL